MIFMNMAYPGKSYRVQVYDVWLGEEFEPMDNPKDGDKIVYRVIGENGQPVEQKTEVYQNGAWVEQGGGGGEPAAPVARIKFVNTTESPISLESSMFLIYEKKNNGVSPYMTVPVGTTEIEAVYVIQPTAAVIAQNMSGLTENLISEMENCSVAKVGSTVLGIMATDATADSSCTITFAL